MNNARTRRRRRGNPPLSWVPGPIVPTRGRALGARCAGPTSRRVPRPPSTCAYLRSRRPSCPLHNNKTPSRAQLKSKGGRTAVAGAASTQGLGVHAEVRQRLSASNAALTRRQTANIPAAPNSRVTGNSFFIFLILNLSYFNETGIDFLLNRAPACRATPSLGPRGYLFSISCTYIVFYFARYELLFLLPRSTAT